MLQREMEDPSGLDSKGVCCAFCCAKTESLTSRILCHYSGAAPTTFSVVGLREELAGNLSVGNRKHSSHFLSTTVFGWTDVEPCQLRPWLCPCGHTSETNGRLSAHKVSNVDQGHTRRPRQASLSLPTRQLMHARSSALHASMAEHLVANPAWGRAEVELTMTHSNHGPFLESMEPNLSASQEHGRLNITNSAMACGDPSLGVVAGLETTLKVT